MLPLYIKGENLQNRPPKQYGTFNRFWQDNRGIINFLALNRHLGSSFIKPLPFGRSCISVSFSSEDVQTCNKGHLQVGGYILS